MKWLIFWLVLGAAAFLAAYCVSKWLKKRKAAKGLGTPQVLTEEDVRSPMCKAETDPEKIKSGVGVDYSKHRPKGAPLPGGRSLHHQHDDNFVAGVGAGMLLHDHDSNGIPDEFETEEPIREEDVNVGSGRFERPEAAPEPAPAPYSDYSDYSNHSDHPSPSYSDSASYSDSCSGSSDSGGSWD